MRNDKELTDYFLFFATNSPKGMAKMKEAMWKVDQSGEFRFSDATNPAQELLFSREPNFDAFRRAIVARFAGKDGIQGWAHASANGGAADQRQVPSKHA
jgi:hypothetical protein